MKPGKTFLYWGLTVLLAITIWGILPAERAYAQAPITVDDWLTSQSPLTLTVPGITSSTVTASPITHVLGTERDFAIALANTGNISASVAGGLLQYTQGTTAQAAGRITWDGVDGNALALDATGLDGLDLTDAGWQNAFLLQASANADVTFTVTVYSNATNASQYVYLYSPGSITILVPLRFPFADFIPILGTGAVFTNVGAVVLDIQGNGAGLNLQTSEFSTTFIYPDMDLEISKTAFPDPAVAGEPITYTLIITNAGTGLAENVTLSDTLSLSTTLQPVDQTDDDDTLLGFGGGTHANTRWYDPRPQNPNSNKWLEMQTPPLSTGVYTSRVMDAANFAPWTALTWEPRRPYWKPLPDNGAADVEYPVGRTDMLGNRTLLHMDEMSPTALMLGTILVPNAGVFSDTSGNDLFVACPATPEENCPRITANGRFNGDLEFEATMSTTVAISDVLASASYALELWVYPQSLTDTTFILRANTLSGTYPISGQHVSVSHLLGLYNGNFIHAMTDEAGRQTIVTAPTDVMTDTWYHIVGTGRAGGALRLYVNGAETTSSGTIGTPWQGGDHYRLGTAYGLTLTHGITGTAQYFTGQLDEVAIYTRTLSSTEVRNHYLRGALRLSFQVRSCDDAACDNEVFTAPTGASAYSELQNTTLGQPTLMLENVLDNRYFQYRAILESDAGNNTPEIRRVRIEPEARANIGTSQGVCTGNAGGSTFRCDLGTLAGGETITLVTQLDLAPSTRGVITNTASITSTVREADTVNNTAVATVTVAGWATLDVRKYDNRPYANLGAVTTYYLDVQNIGPSTAFSVTITDTLPSGLTGYPTGRNGWTCSMPGHTITCTTPSQLVTGDQYVWQRVASITTTMPITEGTITNTVWLTSSLTPLSTTTTITDADTTYVTILADIAVEKWAQTDPITPSATLTYTLLVTNTGPMTATNVWVTDTLPSGLIGYPHPDPDVWASCSTPGNVVGCVLSGTLAMGTGATLDITVTAPLSGFLANNAEAWADEQDDELYNNYVTLYTGILPVADLAISKSAAPDPVAATAPLTYTLVVTNTGPVAAGQYETNHVFNNATNININIPQTHAWNYPSPIDLTSIVGVIRNITVTLFDVEHDFPADLSVLLVGPGGQSVMLMEGAGGGIPTANAVLVFNQAATQTLPLSGTLNSAFPYRPTAHAMGYADLPASAPARPYGTSLTAFADTNPNGSWRLYVADNVPYSDGAWLDGWQLELTIFTDDEVIVTDDWPATLNGPITVNAPIDWACNTPVTQLTCRSDYFAAGASATFVLSAFAPDDAGIITNSAAISSTTTDLVWDDNTATITTSVTPRVDLEIVKSATPLSVPMGAPLTYTLAVVNYGPSAAMTTITVVDTLPAGLTNTTITAATWTCDTSALPVFTCTLDSLPVGTAPMITMTTLAPLALGDIDNTAIVSSAATDPVPANNSATVTVTVTERPILSLMANNDSPTLLGDPTEFTALAMPADGVSYTWLIDDHVVSGSPVTVTYATSGMFTALVTATNSVSVMTATTLVDIVTVAADLMVFKSVEPLTVTVGAPLTYTLVISNAGPDDVLTPITLTDVLPTGLSNILVTAGVSTTCDISTLPTDLECLLASLIADNATTVLTLTADVPGVLGLITNTATVDSAMVDQQATNNTTVLTTTVWDVPVAGLLAFNDSPTLLGDETAFNATVTGGTNIVYTWNFGNGATATGTPLTYTYPATGTYTAIVTATNSTNVLTATTRVTVTDVPVIAFSAAAYSVSEAATATITVTLHVPSPVTVTVNYASEDDTALAAVDYTATSAALTFAPGVTARTFTVATLEDTLDELAETLVLTLSDPGPDAVWGVPSVATLTIVDNDPTPTLNINDVSTDESVALMTFVISLSAESALDVTLNYTTSDGTAMAGADYAPNAEQVLILAGQVSALVPIALVDDAIDETNETLSITLGNPVNATIADAEGVGTIVDDDTAGVRLAPRALIVSEAGLTDTYQVVLESAPTAIVTMSIVPDTQLVPTPAAVAFTALTWATPQTVTVAAVDDVLVESLTHAGTLTHTIVSSDANYTGTFVITVTAVITDNDNTAPVAVDDVYTTTEDVVLLVPATGVLSNDVDAELDALTATLVDLPTTGVLTFATDGGFTYTPTLDFNGVITFTYYASDLYEDSNVAMVTLAVLAVNDAPIVASDVYTTAEDVVLTLAAPGVLGNDGDDDGDALTATLAAGPMQGVLLLMAEGGFVYTPTLNFNGVDMFSYYATDGVANSTPVTVTLGVTPVNDAPVAVGDAYSTTENVPLVVASSGVLLNDSDVESDTLTLVLDDGPTQGALALAVDGGFVYTPTVDYIGGDNFTYHINDGALDSAVVTVTLTVSPSPVTLVYLPVVLRNFSIGPDLVVESILASPDLMVVVIRNQGELPIDALVSNEFWVDLYINPDTAPTEVNQTWDHIGSAGIAWGITADALPLAPGAALTLTIGTDAGPYPYYRDDKSTVSWPLSVGTELWAQADSANDATDYGAVLEDHETMNIAYNNITGPVTVTAMLHAIDLVLPRGPMPQTSDNLPVRP